MNINFTEHHIKTLLPGLQADEEILQMIGFPGRPPAGQTWFAVMFLLLLWTQSYSQPMDKCFL